MRALPKQRPRRPGAQPQIAIGDAVTADGKTGRCILRGPYFITFKTGAVMHVRPVTQVRRAEG